MSTGRLAVDIGGTFTDLCLEWQGKLTSTKVLTTPRAPEEGVLTGLDEIVKLSGLKPADLGKLRPFSALRDAADREDISVSRAFRLEVDKLRGGLMIDRRIGARHASD